MAWLFFFITLKDYESPLTTRVCSAGSPILLNPGDRVTRSLVYLFKTLYSYVTWPDDYVLDVSVPIRAMLLISGGKE